MSNPVFYFVGGEDVDYIPNGSQAVVNTGAGYNGAVSRCGLQVALSGGSDYWRQAKPFSASAFWFSVNVYFFGGGGSNGNSMIQFWDAGFVQRIRIRNTSGAPPGSTTFVVEKVNSVGAATQLGGGFGISISQTTLGRLDIQINYSTTGSVTIYQGGTSAPIFAFSGDVTTDGQTLLAGHLLAAHCTTGSNIGTIFSQIIISDSDTRSMVLQTFAPVANGNTHNFDVGGPAAANVNEVVIDDSTIDGASAASLIDQYTIPAILSGSYAIAAVAMSARLAVGFSGPQHADLGVRSGGSDWWSADQAPITSFQNGFQIIWNTDPATSAAWAALPTNIGLKAVA